MDTPILFWSSIRELVRSATLVVAAIAVGRIAWSGEPLLLPAAMLFPALWTSARSRFCAALVAAAYFLAASVGLPQGVTNFYGSGHAAGIGLWIAASSSFVAVHTIAWGARPGWERASRYAIIAVLLSVPPIGIVGWAHPLTAAGILFPGGSWLGLALAAALLLSMTSRWRPMTIVALAALWFWSALSWTTPRSMDGWVGTDTQFGGSNGEYAGHQQHRDMIARVREEAEAGTSVVVLPESALGVWTPTSATLWFRALEGLDVTVYGGAVVVDETGYDNVMIELSVQGAVVRYVQRMPVPVSMWQPWLSLTGAPSGARAHFFDNPVVAVRDVRLATLICYEQLLVWPILQSALGSPEVLVAPANGWWTSDTDIVAIQIAALTAWARLFNLSLIVAVNT